MLRRLPPRLRPGLVATQIASVGASGLLLGVIAFGALTLVSGQLQYVTAEAEAALLASTIDYSTDYVDLLIQSERDSDGLVQFTPAMTVRVYEQIHLQQESARRLAELAPRPDVARLLGLANAKEKAFRRFSETGDPIDFAAIHEIHVELNGLAERVAPEFLAEAQGDSAETERLTRAARLAVVLTAAVVLSLLTCTTWLISRRLRRMLERSEDERRSLAATTASVERRNDQFRALYEVAADSADDVELDRVAASAAAGARRLLGCDLAILWLTHGGTLQLAAADAGPDWHSDDTPVLEPSAVRRVAGRGRGLITGDGPDADLRDTGVPGARSGVVVPVVARAGIVGVIGCWSASDLAFTEDDRRLIEMLAGQVAPALAAANRYQATEARANTDALTGLHNRHQLTDDILDRFAPALEVGQLLVVAMLDIDDFKGYNDRFGHAAGDAALRLLGRVVQSTLRRTDRAFRYGGEEFLIVFRFTTLEQAIQLVERLRDTVQKVTASTDDLPAGLTFSAGIASSQHEAEFPSLIEHADDALYRAKVEGRNRLSVWDPEDRRAAA